MSIHSHRRAIVASACVMLSGSFAAAQTINESDVYTGDAFASHFGATVAADEARVLIGALGDSEAGLSAGAAYLFDAPTGSLVLKLIAPDAAAFDQFGESVALGDGLAAVGAPYDGPSFEFSGSVSVFDASDGTFVRKLVASDATFNRYFGSALAISGGIIYVGTGLTNSGAVYRFDAATGAEIDRLLSPGGAFFDDFGSTFAVSGSLIAVGARSDSTIDDVAGAVHIFDAGTGMFLRSVYPSNPSFFGYFGTSVALDGNTLAVGSSDGSVAVIDASTGVEQHLIPAPPGFPGPAAVAVRDGQLVVGHVYDRTAKVYDAATAMPMHDLVATDDAKGSLFGVSVCHTGSFVVVGAEGRGGTMEDGPGGAYRFDVAAPCPADLAAPEGVLNFFDIQAFIALFNAMDPAADLAAPFGTWNFFDIQAYIGLYNAGCP